MEKNITSAFELTQNLLHSLGKVIHGRSDTLRLVVAALLADGHVLLEDYPGSGKTTLSKILGRLICADDKGSAGEYILPFRRIQFTPDMLPGDVLGVNIFEPKSGSFRFVHGPIFAHVVLADEINRTGPKVQAAFLECMAEKQVTIDNVTHKLDDLFFVIGTQNPLDIAGTYPLPQVQLDRFLFKVPMSYVDSKTEYFILENHQGLMRFSQEMEPVCSRSDLLKARAACRGVFVSPLIRETIVEIAQATRGNPLIQFGASTRAALMMQDAIRAWALIEGREHASEDDLKFTAPFVLNHRLRFHAGAGESGSALHEFLTPFLEKLISRRV